MDGTADSARYLVESALGSCSSGLLAEWDPPVEFDAVEAASLLPDHPSVWTDGSLVLDRVTGVLFWSWVLCSSCSAVCGVQRTVRAQRRGGARDLGHFPFLVGKRHIVASKHCHQLVHHLRHRTVQKREHGHVDGNLLHGALLIPVLWHPRLTQTGWPGTPRKHLIIVGEFVVLSACVLLSPWGVVLGPGRLVG